MKNSNILLMDEGDSNLDQNSRKDLYRLIGDFDYDLVIVITHHLEKESEEFFDEVIAMKDGKLE